MDWHPNILGDTDNLDGCYYAPQIQGYSVTYDPEISAKSAFDTFTRFLAVEKGVTDIVGLGTVSGYMRELLSNTKLPDCGIIFLVGATQSRKTAAISLSNGFYNHTDDKTNITRLDSSLTGIRILLLHSRTPTLSLTIYSGQLTVILSVKPKPYYVSELIEPPAILRMVKSIYISDGINDYVGAITGQCV